MKQKKLDAAAVLQKLAEMRKSIPFLEDPVPRQTGDGRLMSSDGLQPRTEEEFEMLAIADGVESLAHDLGAALDKKRAELMAHAMEVYYTAEELSHDPEHAHLIPHVQQMREAYERDFGRPIPPKPKK